MSTNRKTELALNPERIDLGRVIDLLDTAKQRTLDLDGVQPPNAASGRDRTSLLAQHTKELLYLAHLLDLARVEVLNEYHLLKGYDDHLPAA